MTHTHPSSDRQQEFFDIRKVVVINATNETVKTYGTLSGYKTFRFHMGGCMTVEICGLWSEVQGQIVTLARSLGYKSVELLPR